MITLVSQLVIPVGWCAALEALSLLSASGIWTAIALGHFVRSGLAILRFRHGDWRRIRIGPETAVPSTRNSSGDLV